MNTIAYNVDEVFEIAEQIERNGAAFYRKAASFSQADARDFLLKLADQEDEHERTFAAIRAALVAAPKKVAAYDQDNIVASYLQALAGQYVFHKNRKPQDVLSGKESLPDILTLAIQQEKDSIVLYLGLMDTLADSGDRDKVRRITKEEQQHLTDLLEKQRAL